SKLSVKNLATNQTVATIDNQGNASFSGTLSAQNVAVNNDATVSGTLYAHKIVADEIDGLQAAVGTLSAQNITNVTNIYFATPSGTQLGENIATGSADGSSSNSGALAYAPNNNGFASIASFSAFLSYVPDLHAVTAMVDEGFTSLGPTSLADTSVTGQLSVGGNLILADNSINVLGADLQIQPLRQGGVEFEGGLIAIDTDGNLTVNGKTMFNGQVLAKTISPLSNSDDLAIQLGQNPTATGSALATANLKVTNASGSAIFNVNQLGDVVASGTASVNKLNFNLVSPALAVSSTEVMATGSAGTAAIGAHQDEVTIDNSLVTANSLIYVTPVGDTGSGAPYLLRQIPGTSFTVGIPATKYTDTAFNWLIVN
ncbi:MAG: hypothetical protein ACREGI_01110, partial [Candidatus Levyibacteriota bacterium]